MRPVFRPVGAIVCRALRVRKKTGGENAPVQMIGDILAAELSHMQPYVRFCSCQINGATLLQTRIDNEPDFKNFLKVRCGEEKDGGQEAGIHRMAVQTYWICCVTVGSMVKIYLFLYIF